MYAVQPQLEEVHGEPLQARRRMLAAAGMGVKADVGVCGQLCQVRGLEGGSGMFGGLYQWRGNSYGDCGV